MCTDVCSVHRCVHECRSVYKRVQECVHVTGRTMVYKDACVPVPSMSSLPTSICSVYKHLDKVYASTCV